MLAAMTIDDATGHLNQSIVSRAVPTILISLTSRLRVPVAISHPLKAFRPARSNLEKLLSAGNVRVVNCGRLFKINVDTDSSVVDDIDNIASTSVTRKVPVIALRPSSVMCSMPFAATEILPVKVVH